MDGSISSSLRPVLSDSDPQMATNACGGWRVDDCEGTPFCPPRCPRFVGKCGTAYLIQPIPDTGDLPESLVEMYVDYPREHRSMGLPPTTERRENGRLNSTESSPVVRLRTMSA